MGNSDDYALPSKCESCGSEDISVRVIWDKGIVRYVCRNCTNARSLPKQSNLKKRTNTTISNWAKQITAMHPFCTICGSKESLEAHHIIPVSHSREWMYKYTNGISLCKRCHYLVHHKKENEE